MISQRRVLANRRNAVRSTGPRTVEGKARSSRNATKHGLAARRVTLRPDEQEAYRRRLAEWEASLRPADAVERDLVAQAVFASVLLDRIAAFEAEGLHDPTCARVVRRHEPRWSRALHQALDALHRRREGPDRTNPRPVATRSPAEPAARPIEAIDRRNEAIDRRGEGVASPRKTSFIQKVCGKLTVVLMVAAALAHRVLGPRPGHEPATTGHEPATTGHEPATTGHEPATSGTARATSGRLPDTPRTRRGRDAPEPGSLALGPPQLRRRVFQASQRPRTRASE